jgi:DNA-binding NtrC family response regulator/tetratricopeptide (TPR) repeat protein
MSMASGIVVSSCARPSSSLPGIADGRGARGEGAAALLAADASLIGLRCREFMARATRGLRRAGRDEDGLAALRRVRAVALWHLGKPRQARAEIERALAAGREPGTRAAALEALAVMGRARGEAEAARRHAADAEALSAACGDAAGVIRARGIAALLLRDEGRGEDALAVQDGRLRLAEPLGDRALLAGVLAERGDLLGSVGRWREARQDLTRSAQLFGGTGDARELAMAGLNQAVLDVAAGDLQSARRRLERARRALGPDGPPAWLGELDLLASDVSLAAGMPGAAGDAAIEALTRFTLVCDRVGECRSRVRLCHALIGLGRAREAAREARRAIRAAPALRRDLRALAGLSLGRAYLRLGSGRALASFELALTECHRPSGILHALRLGRLVALGASREDEEVRLCVTGLEMWGDRRLTAACLADLMERTPPATETAPLASPVSLPSVPLVDAALALAGEADWGCRFAAALVALAPVLPWWRAALVAEPGIVVIRGEEVPQPLLARDLARELARQMPEPMVVSLAKRAWRDHPVRTLHGLASAALVPVSQGRVLYLDRREGERAFAVGDLALAVQLGRLLARHWPAPTHVSEDAAASPLPRFVGRCAALQRLFEELPRLARSDVAVHIYGETGTGKERVAEAVHHHSTRRDRPFVAVNASALSDELFESEMWGHVRGAFSGAVTDRRGLVAEADSGTLFLDEVADLTPRSQARLLRFLTTGEYRRVGESQARRANVRIVTAANVALEARVASGSFRNDLLYRLAETTLSLPPLRERGEDVVLLAQHFLGEEAARLGRPASRLTPELCAALRAHSWPGNVRELRSEIRHLLSLAGDGPLRVEQLRLRRAGPAELGTRSLREAVAAFERSHVGRVLAENGGSRTRSALALGLTRQALLLKMRRLGL